MRHNFIPSPRKPCCFTALKPQLRDTDIPATCGAVEMCQDGVGRPHDTPASRTCTQTKINIVTCDPKLFIEPADAVIHFPSDQKAGARNCQQITLPGKLTKISRITG
ncbi:hypothetical protein AA21952_3417 [Acetobacter oeni LMG 21952]|nr:hypothetical protein AA21952_3417 [Acetobacter oeni LMG 21952]